MRIHARDLLPLIVVAVAAILLTRSLVPDGVARAMIQDSPFFQSPLTPTIPTPLPTQPATFPTPDGFPTPDQFPTLEPPTTVPLPTAAPVVAPTPTHSGFLPAPTITNPNDVGSLPVARPPVTNPGSDPVPTVVADTGAADNPALQAGLALLNFLWLICGGLLLVGGAVAIILIVRRSGPS